MSAFSMGLMGGLGDTLSFLGQRYLQDKDDKEKQAREDAKMAQQAGYQQQLEILKEKAAQAHTEFEESIRGPKYETYETTNDQGQTVKRTVRSSYDPTQKKRIEDTLGEAPVPKPAPTMRNVINGDMESTQQYDSNTGQWSTVGSPGRRWKGSDGVDEDAKTRRAEDNQHALDRRAAQRSIDAEMKEFNRASGYDKQKAYEKMGIDPNAKDAATQYRSAITADKLDFYGLDPVTAKDSGGLMGMKTGQKSDTPAGIPPGAKQGTDGNWYVPDPARPGKFVRVDGIAN